MKCYNAKLARAEGAPNGVRDERAFFSTLLDHSTCADKAAFRI